MPPISDSIIPADSTFRQSLLNNGVALRLVQGGQFAQNVLQPPVPADCQQYVGERHFGGFFEQVIFTSDLRQLHLRHAQFYFSGVWKWVSWNPAGPSTFQIWDLYFYKSFGNGRVELKAGYISNDLEFTGMLVGGSTGTAAQGVYAVLPFEVGMSYFPLTAPSLNLRIRGPMDTYFKVGAQRSIDPNGGPAEVARNPTGFRLFPQGDKLLQIYELGYDRSPSAKSRELWFRAGYLHNSTPYLDFQTGERQSGNHAAYALLDYQIAQPDPLEPSEGVYIGGTAMTAASRFDAYDRYYEARIYVKAPLRSRPEDMASLVGSYTGHSKYFTNNLVAAGDTVWRDSASLTASYSLHVARGQFLILGLSYIHGPAITPRLHDALTFTTSYTMFF